MLLFLGLFYDGIAIAARNVTGRLLLVVVVIAAAVVDAA